MLPIARRPIARRLIARRIVLFGLAALPAVHATTAFAVDALPDSRFVGYAQQLNDFEIASGRLALTKSTNENIRGFAARMVADHTEAAEFLSKARSEAGVSYAPDPNHSTVATLQRLNTLQGVEFDTAYANAQLAAHLDAVAQYGAYSQDGSNGGLRRYAQMQLPKLQENLTGARQLAGGR
jgi:putative membrane protein